MSMTRYRIDGATRVAALTALCALSLVLINACVGSRTVDAPDRSGRTPLDGLTETLDAQQAADFIGQPFPAGASRLRAMGEAALDTMVIARFDAPRQDVVAWLADLGVTAPLEPAYSPFLSTDPPFAEAASWWAPPSAGDSVSDFSGVYQQVGQKHVKLVVAAAESGLMTVHLQVYNT